MAKAKNLLTPEQIAELGRSKATEADLASRAEAMRKRALLEKVQVLLITANCKTGKAVLQLLETSLTPDEHRMMLNLSLLDILENVSLGQIIAISNSTDD